MKAFYLCKIVFKNNAGRIGDEMCGIFEDPQDLKHMDELTAYLEWFGRGLLPVPVARIVVYNPELFKFQVRADDAVFPHDAKQAELYRRCGETAPSVVRVTHEDCTDPIAWEDLEKRDPNVWRSLLLHRMLGFNFFYTRFGRGGCGCGHSAKYIYIMPTDQMLKAPVHAPGEKVRLGQGSSLSPEEQEVYLDAFLESLTELPI